MKRWELTDLGDRNLIHIAFIEKIEEVHSQPILVGAFRGQLTAENALTEKGRWKMRKRTEREHAEERWTWDGWIDGERFVGWIERIELK